MSRSVEKGAKRPLLLTRKRGATMSASDWDVLRRYLGPNLDSYSATWDTLSMIDGSYERRVLRAEAVAALDRLEAEHRAEALPSGEKQPQ